MTKRSNKQSQNSSSSSRPEGARSDDAALRAAAGQSSLPVMNRRTFITSAALGSAAVSGLMPSHAADAASSFVVNLSANVPFYCQEDLVKTCGAACARMTRNGYPNPADRLLFTEAQVWPLIQSHNSTAAQDTAWLWYTDPHGLQGCLQHELNNPSGVNWVEFANTNKEELMFSVLYWMNLRRFPTPVLTQRGLHWVLIVGYETDVEPILNSTPMVELIHFLDPKAAPCPNSPLASPLIMETGSIWLWANANSPDPTQIYWGAPVGYSGTWKDQYVAIIEPPTIRGKVRVKTVNRPGSVP